MSETITRKVLIAWAVNEIAPFLKRGYTSYIQTAIGSVIMKARDEYPGIQMDPNDPDIPAHVLRGTATTSEAAIEAAQKIAAIEASCSCESALCEHWQALGAAVISRHVPDAETIRANAIKEAVGKVKTLFRREGDPSEHRDYNNGVEDSWSIVQSLLDKKEGEDGPSV